MLVLAVELAVLVLSYCWQLDGVPDPDGAVLAKIRERLKALQDTERRRAAQEKREPDDVGLFVDAACLPQTFALANGQCDGAWHCDCSRVARLRSNDVAALGPVKTDRFGAEGDGQLRVLKFIWDKNDPIENAEEAEVCVAQIRSLCSQEGWDLACVSDFKGSGLRNAPCPCGSGREFKACCAQGGGDRDIEDGDGGVGDSARRVGDGSGILGWDWSLWNHGASHSSFISQGEGQGTAGQSSRQRSVRILFHERYASGESRFDRTSKAEGFILFCSEVDARKAQRNEALLGLCGGQRPELIGESVFDNDLKFRRGLSVMGCLYASPAGTSVMQLTAPPAEDGNVSGKVKTSQRDHSAHCRELISKRTGSVFVLQVPDDADRDEGIKQLRAQLEKRTDVLACVDLLDRKDYTAQLVVRFDGEVVADAAGAPDEMGQEERFPMRTRMLREKVEEREKKKSSSRLRAIWSCLWSRVRYLRSCVRALWRRLRCVSKVRPIVFPFYNARPYKNRGWPIFETASATMVLAHIAAQARAKDKGKHLSPQVEYIIKLEKKTPKLVNIDNPRTPHPISKNQPPQHFLKACKKKLLSEKEAKFTGGSDRPKVRLLPTSCSRATQPLSPLQPECHATSLSLPVPRRVAAGSSGALRL